MSRGLPPGDDGLHDRLGDGRHGRWRSSRTGRAHLVGLATGGPMCSRVLARGFRDFGAAPRRIGLVLTARTAGRSIMVTSAGTPPLQSRMSPARRAVILGGTAGPHIPPCGVLRLRVGPAARFRAADGRPHLKSQGAGSARAGPARPRPAGRVLGTDLTAAGGRRRGPDRGRRGRRPRPGSGRPARPPRHT